MSTIFNQYPPSSARLIESTLLAAGVAAVLLVTVVMPAEYGIDPLGTGRMLGLEALAPSTAVDEGGGPAVAPSPVASGDQGSDAANAALAAKAAAAFGANSGQSLDAAALSGTQAGLARNTMDLTLEPGKGAEVKAVLKAGDGMVFHWEASGDVAVDMHGERPAEKGAWTSYAVETAQRAAAGTFVAPFDGTHGWYWQNRGNVPVQVKVQVEGFQSDLFQP